MLNIQDANLNRFREGARVLEDIARFILKDFDLFLEIKRLKHQIKIAPGNRLIAQDIGGPSFEEKQHRHALLDLINANALRMQEAARVLEETTKRHFFKTLRFAAYKVHAEILEKTKSLLHIDKLKGFYAICDPSRYSLEKMIKVINTRSLSICQLRMKNTAKSGIIDAVKALRERLHSECLIIVNDHLDIALAYADGVHLGQNDLPLAVARKLAPVPFIIGVSCHSVLEAKLACESGASYVSVGCLFPTTTKIDTIPVPLGTLTDIVQTVNIPTCAIGGIQLQHLSEVHKTRVDMIAMSSALWGSNLNAK
jgi:thiamine-phosphate pyrophosphorylase